MTNILDCKLEVKVFKYESEDEMQNHRQEMKKQGWKIKDCEACQSKLFGKSTVQDYNDEANWVYITEYYRQKQVETTQIRQSYYETKVYWFSMNTK